MLTKKELSLLEQVQVDVVHAYDRGYKDALATKRFGYWKQSSNGYRCSECNQKAQQINGEAWLSNFCPYCGAKLEEIEK